jgi:hypothetical protein
MNSPTYSEVLTGYIQTAKAELLSTALPETLTGDTTSANSVRDTLFAEAESNNIHPSFHRKYVEKASIEYITALHSAGLLDKIADEPEKYKRFLESIPHPLIPVDNIDQKTDEMLLRLYRQKLIQKALGYPTGDPEQDSIIEHNFTIQSPEGDKGTNRKLDIEFQELAYLQAFEMPQILLHALARLDNIDNRTNPKAYKQLMSFIEQLYGFPQMITQALILKSASRKENNLTLYSSKIRFLLTCFITDPDIESGTLPEMNDSYSKLFPILDSAFLIRPSVKQLLKGSTPRSMKSRQEFVYQEILLPMFPDLSYRKKLHEAYLEYIGVVQK